MSTERVTEINGIPDDKRALIAHKLFQRIIDVIEIDCLFVFRPFSGLIWLKLSLPNRNPSKKKGASLTALWAYQHYILAYFFIYIFYESPRVSILQRNL